ncbi:hypothetical protein INS49_012029 [Diaporthe citri]|uniref:uncharacterized protein n=1 Tax=Diaporthe citri TaxID=83186 RepID=UPI001C8099F3|nr:uncharacterized protein INS49_012029 [Diaporthe citri]KAG6360961.1 hypothetical protein INS49_012029 [Diaporthe citri]
MASIQNQHWQSLNSAGRDSSHHPFVDASEQSDCVDLIDLTADDELDHDHIQQAVGFADDKLDPGRPQQALRVNKSLRNYALDADHRSVKQVTGDGNQYEVGQFVELRELEGLHSAGFIEIKSIHVHKQTGDVVIRGLPYARTRHLGGRLHRMQNEICLVLEIDADDSRPDEEQALREIGPEDILKKRILTNTNKSFPDCRFDRIAYATAQQVVEQAPLCCRWKMRAEYKDASQRRVGRFQGLALEHFSERDSHKIKKRNLGVDEQRARDWRGETIRGGSTFCEAGFIKDETRDSNTAGIQRYAFAEVSAGAGGASRGAEMAGFKVVLATDSCPHACESYRANFPNTKLYEMKITEFAAQKVQQDVDVLHISSSALNEASGDPESAKKICTDLLKSHPRLTIMEQPAAILSKRRAPFLNAIIQSFTEAGYSVQGKLVHMVEYGLPQMRKRFIMIGAGPGETPISWPTATHSSNPTGDQRTFMTEEDAISRLTLELHSLHHPESLRFRTMDWKVRDADKPMDTPISSNGSVYYHPDGERDFTLRELACIQGFPTYHQFEGSYIKKQIGNAFPPSVAMAFYQCLRQHLEEADAIHTDEPAGDPVTSLPEVNEGITAVSMLYDEKPNGSLDEVTPGVPIDVRSVEQPVMHSSRQRTRAAVVPPSPRRKMSPEAQPSSRTSSPTPHTPLPAQQLPTPSTGGRYVDDQRAAPLGLKRDRDSFEEPDSDGDEDDIGTLALETPSKRPRISIPGDGADDWSSARSRTVPASPDPVAGMVENAPIPEDSKISEDADYRGVSGPDDEMLANLARGI